MQRILVIDDDQNFCTLLQRFLTKKGFEVDVAYTADGGIKKYKEAGSDIVLCDYRLDTKNGGDVLKSLRVIDANLRFIMITGFAEVKTAVAMVKEGACDYISKPLAPEQLLEVISKASLEGPPVSASVSTQHTNRESIVIGESANIRELFKQVDLIAPTSYSVIIYGESGTGKEVVARAIHERSERRHYPFVALDCGTLSKELAGSELFGHVKGSFTGAIVEKQGHFEMANGGTLFLDEVGNLSIDIQASLLRVLQERKFKRIGGTQEIEVDIRILVASNENLRESCTASKFREDLYHRLNEFSLIVPPLRERKEDIPLLAEHFLAKASRELNKNVMGFDQHVIELMREYLWPGNVRELMNVIRRVALLTKREAVITKKMLPPEIIVPRSGITPSYTLKDTSALRTAAANAEYETIMEVLKEVNYNKTKAAEMLRIDRKTLYNKLREHGTRQ